MTRIVKLRQDKKHPEVFWVKSSNRKATYRVQVYEDGSVTCDCTHGLNNPGRAHCYHAEAAGKLKRKKEKEKEKEA